MALLTAAVGLSACNTPATDNNGNIFTYTDAAGNVVGYNATDLYDSYQTTGSSLSTEFDKVYEVLIRHYYDKGDATTLESLKKAARKDVETDKATATDNAKTNKTSFQEEFEKILSKHSVKNVDELFEYYLYTEEKSKFESNFYSNYIDAMKDGATAANGGLSTDDNDKLFMPKNDDTYGIGNAGWIKEQMPYVIRHILVKVAASDKEYTQGTLTEDKTSGTDTTHQATKLATVVARLAGASLASDGTLTPYSDDTRPNFGNLAYALSEDASSAEAYGETSLMTKVMSNDLVPEFKLGIYAYESLFNKREQTTAYGAKNVYRVAPGLKESATSLADVDSTQTLEDGSLVSSAKVYGETYDDGSTTGIGQIPFGAAVALMKAATIETDSANLPVYEGNSAFYPRNIIFNKYFNKRNVCVVTPNDIPYNLTNNDTYTGETFDGTPSAAYEALPGFQVNTTDVLPGFAHNVLTDSEGQIVLVARAGTSSYQGVHFMVIQRDALSQYDTTFDSAAKKVNENDSAVDGTATLSQYYTTKIPGLSGYPTTSTGEALTTYVNYNRNTTTDYNDRSGDIVSGVKSYNGALSTYLFEKLIGGLDGVGSLTFQDSDFEATILNYCKQKRQSTKDDNFTTWSNGWKSYAEMLQAQNEARDLRDANGNGRLISEVCAIGYQNHSSSEWQQGGACYYVKG